MSPLPHRDGGSHCSDCERPEQLTGSSQCIASAVLCDPCTFHPSMQPWEKEWEPDGRGWWYSGSMPCSECSGIPAPVSASLQCIVGYVNTPIHFVPILSCVSTSFPSFLITSPTVLIFPYPKALATAYRQVQIHIWDPVPMVSMLCCTPLPAPHLWSARATTSCPNTCQLVPAFHLSIGCRKIHMRP